MKKKNISGLLLVVLLFAVMAFSLGKISSLYPQPYPHFDKLMMDREEFQDIFGIVAGFRGAVADIAWVQFIQYCGGDILPDETSSEPLKLLKYNTLRVIRIDPYFYDAYLFSAGMLAWFRNIDRPDEAIELLQEGIRNNPKYWQFRVYLGAIIYKKSEQYGKMVSLLEEAITYPDCPLLIKAILANYYKARKEYAKAIAVWKAVLESGDSEYVSRAEKELSLLEELSAPGKRGR